MQNDTADTLCRNDRTSREKTRQTRKIVLRQIMGSQCAFTNHERCNPTWTDLQASNEASWSEIPGAVDSRYIK